MFKDFNCCSTLSFGVFSHRQCRSWDKLQMFVFCSFKGPNGFHLPKGSLEEGSPNCSSVHLSPGFLRLCLGQMAGFPQLLSACFCLLRWNKWLLLQKSFFGGFPQLFCTFCSPFSLLDSMLCFFNCLPLQKKTQKRRPGKGLIFF